MNWTVSGKRLRPIRRIPCGDSGMCQLAKNIVNDRLLAVYYGIDDLRVGHLRLCADATKPISGNGTPGTHLCQGVLVSGCRQMRSRRVSLGASRSSTVNSLIRLCFR